VFPPGFVELQVVRDPNTKGLAALPCCDALSRQLQSHLLVPRAMELCMQSYKTGVPRPESRR
jgi:hypothetical protein